MKINSEHPCDVCDYRDKSCPYDCIFCAWTQLWQPCENYDCMYYDCDVRCNFANKCGAYKGQGRPDLDFDEDEEDDNDNS